MQPRGERLRRAIQWISERRNGPGRPPRKLLDEAGLRFDLTPAECEFLGEFYRTSGEGQDAGGSGGPAR